MKLTAEMLRQFLHYDPVTGIFRWRAPHGRMAAGSVAGSRQSGGYLQINVAGERYFSHRLAWLFVHGEWPENLIDHRDGRRDHNAIANLRQATSAQNSANSKMRSRNTAGLKGAFWKSRERRWESSIRVSGRDFYLGRFATKEAAHAAYVAAAKKFNGDFARSA